MCVYIYDIVYEILKEYNMESIPKIMIGHTTVRLDPNFAMDY